MCPAELIVQPPLVDTEMPHHPLGFKGPAIRADRMQVFEDLLVGYSTVWQIGTNALKRD
jgi:hypothetical protein